MKKLLITLLLLLPMAAMATTMEEHEKLWKEKDKNYIAYLRGLAHGARLAATLSMTRTNRYLFCQDKSQDDDDFWDAYWVNKVVKTYADDYKGAPIETIFMFSLPKVFPCENQKVFPGGQ